jgi:hypothetical protein
MTKTLKPESSPTAKTLPSGTETTQSGHSATTAQSLIGLDSVINELKRLKAGFKCRDQLQKAAAMDRAIAVFRGMA